MTEEKITIEQLRDCPVLWGDLMWRRGGDRITRLGSCGDFVNFSVVEKVFNANGEVYIQSHLNYKLVDSVTDAFARLKMCSFESERKLIRKEIVSSFMSVFMGQEQSSYIDWIIIGHKSFYEIPKEIEEVYFSKNINFLQRSMLVASITTVLSILFGYMDWSFLKKVYNTCVVVDFDLVQVGLSFCETNELEKNRLESSGPFNLSELTKYKSRNYEKLDESLKLVTDSVSSLESIIHFNHEFLQDGKGLFGVYDSEVSDLHKIVSFVERFVSYNDKEWRIGDATGTLVNYIESIEGYFRLKKLINIESSRAA